MDTIIWNLSNGTRVLAALWRPFAISMLLYFSGYWFVWFASLARVARLTKRFRKLDASEAVDVLVVVPTMLRSRDELEELRHAATTIVGNRYPGRVVTCLAIDGSDVAPALVDEIERWGKQQESPVLVARVPKRGGKGVAVAAGLARAELAVQRGELSRLPPIFFNMDADSELGPRTLERMVAKLVRPKRRPMIVASNVLVRREHYWQGVRHFFTMRGQLALQVAREYMTSISIARPNFGILPVTGVSGALYATWTELHQLQPRHASFMLALRRRDVVAWWLGRRPPSFARFTGAPNIAATAGPGDDTWLAWLAMAAHWRGDKISLELPRTPAHAFARLVDSFFRRPIAYDHEARVYTATPTTVRALFKQRVRWNSSRGWLLQRFGAVPYMSWDMGAWVVSDLLLTLVIHATILVGLLGWPFSTRPAAWLALVVLGIASSFAIRAAATLLAILQEGDLAGHWHKLLAIPLSGPYHVVFNIFSTIVGFVLDYLGFGLNTHFAPEETLAASQRGRLALSYRSARCAKLIARALWRGDVEPGWFWFGWHRTRWTASGYAGWTNKALRYKRGGL
ncbi:MAG TPA: glycosyltransferase family 2 protein [Kofleriaceae bacterium]|jgi:hypothetical protein